MVNACKQHIIWNNGSESSQRHSVEAIDILYTLSFNNDLQPGQNHEENSDEPVNIENTNVAVFLKSTYFEISMIKDLNFAENSYNQFHAFSCKRGG